MSLKLRVVLNGPYFKVRLEMSLKILTWLGLACKQKRKKEIENTVASGSAYICAT